MINRRWKGLSRGRRRLIVIMALFDASMKTAALVDLRSRPAEQIRGPRLVWAVALVLINSAGALPAAYFVLGRRHRRQESHPVDRAVAGPTDV